MAEVIVRAVNWHQAAEMYDVSLGRIKGAIATGDLRAKRVGRGVRIDVDDLAAWFAQLPDA